MTIEQTIEIPADHRLILDVPREVPAGTVILTFTPVAAAPTDETPDDEREKMLAILKHAHGAWKDKPWTNHLEDIRSMREEWDDPWDPAVQESCRAVMREAREAADTATHE